MKTDTNGASTCPLGAEQFEAFFDSQHPDGAVQYDYRHTNGRLSSTVRPTVDACRAARDQWAAQHGFIIPAP